MSELPLATEEQLQSLSPQTVIEFYMKLQQIALMGEDEIASLRRIIVLQQDLLEMKGIKK